MRKVATRWRVEFIVEISHFTAEKTNGSTHNHIHKWNFIVLLLLHALGGLSENIYSCRRLYKESWLLLSLFILEVDQQDKIKLAIAAHPFMSATTENEFSQQGTAQFSAHKVEEDQA